MKIHGGGPGTPVDLQKVKAQKEGEAKAIKDQQQSSSSDVVDAKLSQTLNSITDAIQTSGITAAELHSNIDEERAATLLESFELVAQSKQPRLEDDQILEMADRVSGLMDDSADAALKAFGSVNRARVEELLS
jgi:hypothetical protein